MAYCIIKLMKTDNGIELPVVLLDNHDEVWEFDDVDIAIKMSEILTKNPNQEKKSESTKEKK